MSAQKPDRNLVPISSRLPFSLRLTGGLFKVTASSGSASFSLERMPNGTPDERIHGGGDFDFRVDRQGWASYTKADAEVEPAEAYQHDPIRVYLDCLNLLISHLRDLGHPWMRQLEDADLFHLSVKRGEVTYFGPLIGGGRTSGVTPAVTGLTEEATKEIRRRLEARETVALWRIFQLDAFEALETARYDESVILAWTSLESAARTELPNLARTKGLSPEELWEKLLGNRARIPPLSYEEVLQRGGATVFSILELVSELSDSGYDSGSLAYSTRNAYILRNLIVHDGFKLSGFDAQSALDSVSFVLGAWHLKSVQNQPEEVETSNWLAHYGSLSPDLLDALGLKSGRIVLHNPKNPNDPDPLFGSFDLTLWNNRCDVFVPAGTEEKIAAMLFVLYNDTYQDSSHLPHLAYDQTTRQFFSPSLLSQITSNVNRAVFLAYSLLQREREGWNIRDAANYQIRSWRYSFARISHTFHDQDVRFQAIASWFAAFLSKADESLKQEFRSKLTAKHGSLISRAFELEGIFSGTINPDDPHSLCNTFRSIHDTTTWLDTITVICPQENIAYGTRHHPLDGWMNSQRDRR